jgi:hypothetical protein
MPNPTRETTGGRVYNDLRNLAKREGLSSADVMLSYTLERFLYRLARSPEGGRHFVLKGGLLLAQFGARRATRDIDLLGRYFTGEDGEVIARIKAIAAFPVDDGVLFDPDGVRTVPIRTGEPYAGLRLTMPAALSRAQLKLQLDISFGDPITPEARLVNYAQRLDPEPFQIYGYPIDTVIAEKLTTAIDLAEANTRDRDYADLYRLICQNDFDTATVRTAVERTAHHRGLLLRPLSIVIGALPTSRQLSYTRWLSKQEADRTAYPTSFAEICATVIAFADPLLTDTAGTHWSAADRQWH